MVNFKLIIVIVAVLLLAGVWTFFIIFLKKQKKAKEKPAELKIEEKKEVTEQKEALTKIEDRKITAEKKDVKSLGLSEEPLFKLADNKEITKLPDFTDEKTVDFRYPLIPPYTHAHVKWDNKASELLYTIEEPELTNDEQKLLNQLEDGIKELINLSFISVSDPKTIIIYLEKNIRVLLTELAIPVSKESFLKIMYYIYRDFVGLNELEPLMNDPNIEDVECNGVGSPVYVVHRKYRNIRTSLIYKDVPQLTAFVEKVAQKCGKYISYAEPILDASLPGGSRVNATYSQEISSKGPSYTIRKFTSEPWSGIQLMEKGTTSPEMLAFLWMLIEYGNSMMVIGGTGSGKTSLINVIAFFIPPQARVVTIEDSVTADSRIIVNCDGLIKNITIKELYDNYKEKQVEVLTVNDSQILEFVQPSKFIKHRVKKEIYEIITSTGRRVKITKDHSIFTLGENGLEEITPIDLKENESFIAVPRLLPINGNNIKHINLFDNLKFFDKEFLAGEPVKKIFSEYSFRDFGVNKSTYQWWKRNNLIRIKRINNKINFTDEELKQLVIKSRLSTSIPLMFIIDEDFITFCGLWVAEGSYDNRNKNVVIVSNTDPECREIVKRVAEKLHFNYSIMNDKGTSIRIHSTVFYKLMDKVFGLSGYSFNKKIPDFIFNLSNEQLKFFLRGYYSGDGSVHKYEVSCSSQSRILLEDIQTILLRYGIISRMGKRTLKDKCIRLSISENKNIELFREIGFLQERQNIKLNNLVKKATHTSSDIIPLSINKFKELNNLVKIQWNYLNGKCNIGRDFLQRIAPKGSEFNDISHNDILWDKVKKIRKLKLKIVDVYDLSIPKYEKFICNNIIVHNTSELKLEHENWLPSVSRAGVGVADLAGKKHGEVTLFDLLKASFRQRPDYIIVGEVRGVEASVLMQSAASGHACMGTMHAESVDTMIRRLQTPPINLSGALIESLAAVAIMQPTKVKGKEVRRLTKIDEIISVKENLGGSVTNTVFKWVPGSDSFAFNPRSKIIQGIAAKYGWTAEQVLAEMKRRSLLLRELYKRKVTNYKDVQRVVNLYFKDPKAVLKAYGIK